MTSGYYAGYYFLVSALMSNMVLAMYESPGDQNTQAVLKPINYNNNLMFLSLSPRSDSSYYLKTNSTGNSCALNVKNSSFAQLTKITQKYIYNDNCAWFFEPADQVITSFGVNYAYNNWWSENPYTGEIVAINTYPYFMYGDCANFVSQCLNASGFKYQYEWRINKWNDTYPYPADSSQLDNSWETYTNILGISPWISAQGFQDFWISRVDYSYDTIVSDYYYNGLPIGSVYGIGDVSQLLKKNDWGLFRGYHTVYLTLSQVNDGSKWLYYTAHTDSQKDKPVTYFIGSYHDPNMYKLRFYNFA